MKRVVPRFSGVRKIRLGRGLSLATRIILINIVAMVLMLAGLLYFGRYMDRFVTAEVSTLINQAGLIAGTLGEVAVENTEEGDTLETDTARQVIRRLVGTSDTRTRVFSPSSLLVADSRLLRGAGRYVEVEQLDPPDALSHPSLDIILGLFDKITMFMPNHGDLPVFADTALPGIDQLPDVEAALHGENHWTLWTTEDSELVLTVAVPIQRVQQIVGAVMLSRDSRQLASAIRQMRTDMLKSFSIVLSMSILLSLYLAQTIARPLRRLARAATSTDVIA